MCNRRYYNFSLLLLPCSFSVVTPSFVSNTPYQRKNLHRDADHLSHLLHNPYRLPFPTTKNHILSPLTTTTTTTPPFQQQRQSHHQTTLHLSSQTPPDEKTKNKKTRLALEFQSMMDSFSQYTPTDISTLPSPRYRALFNGIAAGSTEPPVLRAFEVLFEDMVPLRIAGRMIYRHLIDVMDESNERREEEERLIGEKTGLSSEEIRLGRGAFLRLRSEEEKEGMSMEELVESGIVETVVELFGYDSFEVFLEKMSMMEGDNELLNFEMFMIGLQRCTADSEEKECTIPFVLHEISERMGPIDEQRSINTVDERKRKYAERYDAMVETFQEWEDRVPDGEGRNLDVLRGCFVGAKNVDIVNALRIVYLDYSALRVAGDLVFKLMRKVVGKKKTTA